MFGEILTNKKLTIKEISEGSGVPRSTIADLISGKTGIEKMSACNLYKLSRFFNINMEDFYIYCSLDKPKSEEIFIEQENAVIINKGLKLYVRELARNNLVETCYAVNDMMRFKKYMSAVRDFYKYRLLELPERYADYVVFIED